MQLAANILGYLGIACTLFIYFQKHRENLLLWKLISDLFWVTHFILIGASSAVAVTSVALIRTVVFLNRKHAWAQGKHWFFIFLGFCLFFSAIGWEGPISSLTLLGSIGSLMAFWCDEPRLTRIISVPVGVLLLIYYLQIGSLQPIICQFFVLISTMIGFLRHDIHRSSPQKATPAQLK